MEVRASKYKIAGMSQDLSQSAFNSEVSFENHNIRITSNNGNTLLSATNERGNLDSGIYASGTCIGYCNIGDNLVLFTTSDELDRI